ncbi:hypothetical protein G6F68_017175 [Rhizopus microsporus]|nr:hypothetical protein G6F68_017175 [Rhizopus microsporus]
MSIASPAPGYDADRGIVADARQLSEIEPDIEVQSRMPARWSAVVDADAIAAGKPHVAAGNPVDIGEHHALLQAAAGDVLPGVAHPAAVPHRARHAEVVATLALGTSASATISNGAWNADSAMRSPGTL